MIGKNNILFFVMLAICHLGQLVSSHTLADYTLTDKELFFVAARDGDAATVQRLLIEGINPDTEYRLGACLDTPLILACENGHAQVAQLLLDADANPEKATRTGWTPLMNAVLGNHKKVVALLIDRGALVNAQDVHGTNALMIAINHTDCEMTQYLLDHGALIDACDNEGKTPLINIVSSDGKKDIIDLLLRRGASVDATDLWNNTALMHAALSRHEDYIELLLQHQVHVHMIDPCLWASLKIFPQSQVLQLYADTYADALEPHADLIAQDGKKIRYGGKKNFRTTYRKHMMVLDKKMHQETKFLENIENEPGAHFCEEHKKYFRLKFNHAFQAFKIKQDDDKGLRQFFFHPRGGLAANPGLVPMVSQCCKQDAMLPILATFVARTPLEKQKAEKIKQVLKDRDAFFERNDL